MPRQALNPVDKQAVSENESPIKPTDQHEDRVRDPGSRILDLPGIFVGQVWICGEARHRKRAISSTLSLATLLGSPVSGNACVCLSVCVCACACACVCVCVVQSGMPRFPNHRATLAQ